MLSIVKLGDPILKKHSVVVPDINDDIRTLVMQNADAATIRRSCQAKGMKLLRQDGAERVLTGETTVSELLRMTQEDIH